MIRLRRAVVVAGLALVAAGCGWSRESPAPVENLALGRATELSGAAGDASSATDGQLAPEGSGAGPHVVLLPHERALLTVDLGAPREVGALLLQAEAAGVYQVEGSLDRRRWIRLWRVAAWPAAPGLRTRRLVLPAPEVARWLMVRTTTAGPAGVAELQAFAREPERWPAPDSSGPAAALPLWPRLTRARWQVLVGALAAVMLVLAGWGWVARVAPVPPGEPARRMALRAFALAALFAWPAFLNFNPWGFVHRWEFFHYYLGGKYLPELGYDCLYVAAAAVDAEDGLPAGERVRDLRDDGLLDGRAALVRAPECRARFSDQRWSAFRQDARFFRTALGPGLWDGARVDHGFNAPPAWAILGRSLAELGPASWRQVTLLALLDPLLIVAMLLLMLRTFGSEAACLAAGYWGLNALSPFGWTGGGYLRQDWVFLLVAGACALRRGRAGLAGFAWTLSAALRVFPGCVLAALLLKHALQAVRERSLAPLLRQRRLALGCAAALLLVAASTGGLGLAGRWPDFTRNSARHLRAVMGNTVGLQTWLAFDDARSFQLMSEPLDPDPEQAWRESQVAAAGRARPWYWMAVAAYLVLLGAAVLKAPDWAAAILGLGLMPVAFKLTGYYYSAFVLYAALASRWAWAGLALAVLTWTSGLVPGLWAFADEQAAWWSLAVLVFAGGVTLALAAGRTPLADEPDGE